MEEFPSIKEKTGRLRREVEKRIKINCEYNAPLDLMPIKGVNE
jgi:hypothetical protein